MLKFSLDSSISSLNKIASETIECRASSRPLSDRKRALSPPIPLNMMQSSYSLAANTLSLPGPSNKIYKKGISVPNTNKEINLTSSSSSSPAPGDFQRIAYSSKNKFPFAVFIQPSKERRDSPPLHPLAVSRALSNFFLNDIHEVRKLGKTRILVELKTAEAANKLVDTQPLAPKNLKIFIPAFKVMRVSIIRNVPQDLDINSIKDHIESPHKILDIERLNRRVKDGDNFVLQPSRTIRLKFKGQILPNYISIYRVKHDVFPFITKIRIYYSCFRIGHVSNFCKSKPRCIHCSMDRHPEATNAPPNHFLINVSIVSAIIFLRQRNARLHCLSTKNQSFGCIGQFLLR